MISGPLRIRRHIERRRQAAALIAYHLERREDPFRYYLQAMPWDPAPGHKAAVNRVFNPTDWVWVQH